MDILDTISCPNPAATSVNAYRFGKFDSNQQIAQCVAGDAADGVIQFTTDGAATLMYDGILQVAASGALSAGVEVASDANGRAVLAAGSNALGRLTNGTSAAALDDMVEIQWYRKAQKTAGAFGGVAPNLLSVNGAIPVTPSSYNVITKGSALLDTVAAPTADGVQITVTSDTAFAHVLTFTGNTLDTGAAPVLTATFAAFKGAGMTFVSYNGRWKVLFSIGVTFT